MNQNMNQAEHNQTVIRQLSDRSSHLRASRAMSRFVRTVAAVAVIAAIVVLALCLSDMNFRNASGYVPTQAEQHRQTVRAVAAVAIVVAGSLLFAFCERINSVIDRELDRCRRIRRKKIRRQMQLRNGVSHAEPIHFDEQPVSPELAEMTAENGPEPVQ